MPDISINAADGSGSFTAYCATPTSGSGPGVVVLQEIFGVNQIMRDLCDGFAAQGYIAVAPDLFWRIEPGVQLTDKSQEEWDRAFDLMNTFLPDFEKGVADIAATIRHVRGIEGCTGKVGAVGYCLGGSLAYAAACVTDADACSGYYPVQIEDLWSCLPVSKTRCSCMSPKTTDSARRKHKRRSKRRSARMSTSRFTLILA